MKNIFIINHHQHRSQRRGGNKSWPGRTPSLLKRDVGLSKEEPGGEGDNNDLSTGRQGFSCRLSFCRLHHVCMACTRAAQENLFMNSFTEHHRRGGEGWRRSSSPRGLTVSHVSLSAFVHAKFTVTPEEGLSRRETERRRKRERRGTGGVVVTAQHWRQTLASRR